MPHLTTKQEERFRTVLFKARYKSLAGHGLSNDERFAQALIETSDEKINLNDYPGIIEEWLAKHTTQRA